MTDDERALTPPGARTAGAKRPLEHSPPRLQSGATSHDSDFYSDEEAEHGLSGDRHYSEDDMAGTGSDDDRGCAVTL